MGGFFFPLKVFVVLKGGGKWVGLLQKERNIYISVRDLGYLP